MADTTVMSNEEMMSELMRLREEMNSVKQQLDEQDRGIKTVNAFIAAITEAQDFERTMLEVESVTKQITGCEKATLYCFDSSEDKFYTSNGDYRDWQDSQSVDELRSAMNSDISVKDGKALIPITSSNNVTLGVVVAEKESGFEGVDFSLLKKGGQISNTIDLAVNKELNHQAAVTDELTGMKNRDGLNEYIQTVMCSNLTDAEKSVNIIMCDIDHFKSINDTYGHDAGDAILKNVAKVLMEHTRKGEDCSFRIGGEEMLCIMNCSPLEAIEAAERLRAEIEKTVMHTVEKDGNKQDIKVTVSMGVHEMEANELATPANARQIYDAEYKEADNALYAAKETGRNRVVSTNENAMKEFLAYKTAELLCGGNDEVIPDVQANIKALLVSGQYERVIGAIEGVVGISSIPQDKLPQAQHLIEQVEQLVTVTEYKNEKISETEKSVPTDFFDWSKFGENEYDAIAKAVHNKENLDISYVLYPNDPTLSDYQVDINIKPFGKDEWALDCDVFVNETDGINGIGYYASGLPDISKFKSDVEKACAELIKDNRERNITPEKPKTKKTVGNTDYKNIGDKDSREYITVDSRHAYNVGKQLNAVGVKWVGFVKDNGKTTIVINKADKEIYKAANETVKAMYDQKREAALSEAKERCEEGLKEVAEAVKTIDEMERTERNKNAQEM